jgi:predicted chitinase
LDKYKTKAKVMKHIKSFTGFIKINENAGAYNYFMSLLGGEKAEDLGVGKAAVEGDVKFNVSGDKGKNIQVLIDTMKAHGITNPITQIAMLSVIGKESGFIPKNETPYTNTPNGRIRKIFGKRVKGLSDKELDALKKDETKFWDRVYGQDDPTGASQKMGNTNPGDGKKYTGKGFNGLTFKNLYQKYQKMLETSGKLKRSVNIVNNPEQLNEVDVAAEVAVLYFLEASKNPAMKQKYGVDDLNAFKDQKKAIKALAHANAGWGKDIDNSPVKPYEKAQEVAQNFKIDSTGTASLA